MQVDREKRNPEISNIVEDYGYKVPSWQKKPIVEGQHTKNKQEGAYEEVYDNKLVQKMKVMKEFKKN